MTPASLPSPPLGFGRRTFRRRRQRMRPAAEVLEDRVLLTAYVIDTLAEGIVADDGKVSLREALTAADENIAVNEAAAGQGGGVIDVITFAPSLAGGTILLRGRPLGVGGDTRVVGPGASRLTISGNGASRVFDVVGGAVDIRGLTVTGGNAGANAGGGIVTEGRLTLTDCIVRGNAANYGGGIAVVGSTGGLATFGGLVTGNSAARGGGIANNGTLTVSGSTLSGNTAADGGGIYNQTTATATVSGSTLAGNTDGGAHGLGGGIFNSGVLTVVGSTVGGNSSGNGGGIFNQGTMSASNVTLTGNVARAYGGGISNVSTATLRNVTAFENRADSDAVTGGVGGGVFHGAGLTTLYNTLVAGNLRGIGSAADDAGGTLAAGSSNNVIASAATSGGLANGVNGNVVGANVASLLDPAPRDNGGPTLTHRLLVGSVAIDAGNNSFASQGNGSPLATDQRGAGFARRQGARVDVGAFESTPAADLIGYHAGTWQVAASTGSAFDSRVWSTWQNLPWDALIQGDFDGDGRTDVLGLLDGIWQVGLARGAGASAQFATTLWGQWENLDWRDVTTGDLDGDGKDDVVARLGGAWHAALSAGTSFGGRTRWAAWHAAPWKAVSLADLNGDGRDDLLANSAGQWHASLSAGSAFGGRSLWSGWADLPWQTLGTADFDADGRADVVGFYRGTWQVGRSTGTGFATGLLPLWADLAWKDPLTGDFDGDGKADVAARSGGLWQVTLATGRTSVWEAWPDEEWKDVRAADFDGDGRDDLVARRAGGNLRVAVSTGSAFVSGGWGRWADVPWRAVAAADATGHQVSPAAAPAFRAGLSASPSASVPPMAGSPTDDEPLARFWTVSDQDEEFASGLVSSGR